MGIKKRRLIIVGAGAMAREACQYATESLLDCEVAGFLDSRTSILDGFLGYPPILSSVEDYILRTDDVFLCAIGDPVQRRQYVETILSRGARFISIIHPRAYIGRNVSIGQGCIVAPSAVITCDVTLGNHVFINVQSSVSHDCTLGDYVTVSPGCHLAGGCRLGAGTFLGCHSALIPRTSLATGVFVAAGAVVVESEQRPDVRLMGIPAKMK